MIRFVRFIAIVVLLAGMYSCASKKPMVTTSTDVSVSELISGVDKNSLSESFYERKMNVSAGGLSVNGSMKIVPNERVWMNISLLGITFGRAMFTQDSLMYYEKAEKTAFVGSWEDFYSISPKFKAVDFLLVQNILTAQAIFELKPSLRIKSTQINTTSFSIQDKSSSLTRFIVVDNSDFSILSQGVMMPDEGISLTAEYLYMQGERLPCSIIFTFAAEDQKGIRFEFSPARGTTNEDFPFKIPSGYSDARLLVGKLFGTDI